MAEKNELAKKMLVPAEKREVFHMSYKGGRQKIPAKGAQITMNTAAHRLLRSGDLVDPKADSKKKGGE